MLLVIPVYWRAYGPADFLWFCDVAAILTIVALWRENSLLASMSAVAMTLPQTAWIIDFLTGGRVVGVARYMFDPGVPLYVRGLSTFHLWLPFLLLWMVSRLGYDRRALACQIALSTAVLIASYALTDPRKIDPRQPPAYPAAAVNVNRVYGPEPKNVQTRIPELAYLAIEIVFWPVVFYMPTHWVFRQVFRRRSRG
ncbi:MAG TPA: hypothetical protein VIM11_16595 [Tepidisphaeraceae bacterium]|jgi:hypothetical protein